MNFNEAQNWVNKHRQGMKYGVAPGYRLLNESEIAECAAAFTAAGKTFPPDLLPGAAPAPATDSAAPASSPTGTDDLLGYDAEHKPVRVSDVKREGAAALARCVTFTELGETIRAASPGGRAFDDAVRRIRGAFATAAANDFETKVSAVREFVSR